MKPTYAFSQLKNIRDLGGFKTKDGKTTRANVFVRADLPSVLTEEERLQLIENGVTADVDLRQIRDHLTKPDVLATDSRFTYYPLPMFECRFYTPENPDYYAQEYVDIMSDNRGRIRVILEHLARIKEGVIFHCLAGKDRTGITAMLLLMIAGVPDREIWRDYGESYYNLIGKVGPEAESGFKAIPYATVMRRTIELFYETFGSLEAYLDSIGLSRDDRDAIYAKFVES